MRSIRITPYRERVLSRLMNCISEMMQTPKIPDSLVQEMALYLLHGVPRHSNYVFGNNYLYAQFLTKHNIELVPDEYTAFGYMPTTRPKDNAYYHIYKALSITTSTPSCNIENLLTRWTLHAKFKKNQAKHDNNTCP